MKHSFAIFTAVMTMLLCAGIYMLSVIKGKPDDYIPVHTYTPVEVMQPQEEIYEIDKERWYMLLVNKQQLMPRDYTPDVKAINSYGYYFDSRAIDYLLEMIDAARQDGINLRISSAYRSIDRQTALYNRRVNELIAAGYSQADAQSIGSMQVSPPGTSEHNTGLAVDIIGRGTVTMDESFEDSEEFRWLIENCTEYGFILRYPKDKEEITQVTYEPWHYRYVGKEDAVRITEAGVCLEEYLA